MIKLELVTLASYQVSKQMYGPKNKCLEEEKKEVVRCKKKKNKK